MMVRIQAALVAVMALALVLIGSVGGGGPARTYAADPAPTPTPVTTGNIPLLAISPLICVLLEGAAGMAVPAPCEQFDVAGAAGHTSMMSIEDFSGNKNGILEPEDFKSIDLDGNQVHQLDDFGAPGKDNGSLFIMAFVPNQGPVTFRTNLGVFVPAGSPSSPGGPHPTVDDVGQTWVCDNTGSGLATLEDADCGPGYGDGDHVVVARLRARYGTSIADIGPGTVTVKQAITDSGTIAFRVVGEPHVLAFTTLEPAVQDGVTDPNTECKLPSDAAGFLEANSNPQKAIVLAKALDIEGNSITGAIVNWGPTFPTDPVTHKKFIDSSTSVAGMATGLTPTLDLGSFGFGAPNILCGTKNPGTVTVTATGSTSVHFGAIVLPDADPEAVDTRATVEFKVVGVPASVTAAAVPAALNCDGTATSTVTVTVLDAEGTPVTSGNDVQFDVQVLGTANPIVAKTNGDGVATSTITPFASRVVGVPVTITVGDVATSVRIDCQVPAAAAPGGAPPPAGAPSGGGAGVITGPNTGTGGALSGSGAGVPVWAYALLALGAIALSAGSMMTAARTKNR